MFCYMRFELLVGWHWWLECIDGWFEKLFVLIRIQGGSSGIRDVKKNKNPHLVVVGTFVCGLDTHNQRWFYNNKVPEAQHFGIPNFLQDLSLCICADTKQKDLARKTWCLWPQSTTSYIPIFAQGGRVSPDSGQGLLKEVPAGRPARCLRTR